MRHILVTGGAGFVGSAVCRDLVQSGSYKVVVADKLTYAGNPSALEPVSNVPHFRFEHCDIADDATISRLLREEGIDCVMHLAAETHVDRSIKAPEVFIETNIVGTFRLLQSVLAYWRDLDGDARSRFRFHLVSTDEVFGDVPLDGSHEIPDGRYRPSSPYSASKAASDHLVTAWHRTYGIPVVTSHSSNTYGPYQFRDKLIPLIVLNAIEERPLPIYGTGANMRDWLYVDDHARALELVLTRGLTGQAYSIASGAVRSNLDVVHAICRILDKLRPRPGGKRHEELIVFVADRPGHDRRYANPSCSVDGLGWAPSETFESGLAKTVLWYLNHPDKWHAQRGKMEL